MPNEIRPIAPEEFEAFAAADAAAFGFDMERDQLEQTRAIFEFDRTLASFDGGDIAGTAAIFSFDLTVPGGALPTAGVTWVSVKPTHRRQGVLTDIMRRQLDDIRKRGEALAALWASESLIYERFGYGLASEGVELRIDRRHTAFAHEPPSRGPTRLITRDEALATWPAIYDAAVATQPGMFTRNETWWKHKTLREPDRRGGGFSGRFYVQYEEDGRPLGYARYRIRGGNQDGSPDGTLAVQELTAATDGAYAALWRYLFGVDLIGTIESRHRPVDEPLIWMLSDPRRLIRHPSDALWLRIVDVPAALEARRYSASDRVIFEVRDLFCPWTEGRYELEAGPEGARCRPTEAAPDISLGMGELSAIYLGGARLSSLRRAGRVAGGREALLRADRMFSWDPLPWCPEVF